MRVEHCSVIAEDLRECANDNLVETYFRLGLAAPQSGVWQDEGFRACLGGFAHPICNFAVPTDLDPWSAKRLHHLAKARPDFHVYLLPRESAAVSEETLRRADFGPVYSLVSMSADPKTKPISKGSNLQMRKAEDQPSRDRIADFMARLFFAHHPISFRERVKWSTSKAQDLDLFVHSEKGRPVATVMISRSPGTLGVYNLAVAPTRRNEGIGTELVSWCLELAFAESRSVILQCDPNLAGWYSSLGFSSLGRIKVFSLLNPENVAIMGSGSVF
jgi:ribosomal protein S18 acetylase RimI-like enzyme